MLCVTEWDQIAILAYTHGSAHPAAAKLSGLAGATQDPHFLALTPTKRFCMDVVVVESPAKAKTINKYLGKGYKVVASYGHVRDLPAKDGSVQPDHDFAMAWEVSD